MSTPLRSFLHTAFKVAGNFPCKHVIVFNSQCPKTLFRGILRPLKRADLGRYPRVRPTRLLGKRAKKWWICTLTWALVT